jgi:hypothetical protein
MGIYRCEVETDSLGLNGCEGKQPSPEIHPKEIKGAPDVGYVLDLHAISSTMIGYNEFGHPESDTQTSPPGDRFRKVCRAKMPVLSRG